MRKIGPILQVPHDYVPSMSDAIDADIESGSHELNNAKSEQINKLVPTIMAMGQIIEMERDELLNMVRVLKHDIQKVEQRLKDMRNVT